MKRLNFIAALLLAPSDPSSGMEAPLDLALRAALHVADTSRVPSYVSAKFDLNGDGLDDALVLITDNRYCGSGGCVFLVFKGVVSGLKLISESTITKPPIRISHELLHGWRSLVVDSGGTGNVVLEFDGRRYPSNPSLQRRATSLELADADVVISGHGGMPNYRWSGP